MSQHKSTFADGREHAADAVSGIAKQAQDVIADAATTATAAARSVARTAADAIDDHREVAARVLTQAASSLHDGAAHLPGGEQATSLADAAAARIDTAAKYVRQHTMRRMSADFQHLIQQHPGASVLIATAVGVLVGRGMRR